MKQLIRILFLLLVFSLPLVLFGQLKIGVVSPQVVLSQLPETQRIEERMQSFVQLKEKEYGDAATIFQSELSVYQEKMNSMPEADRNSEEMRLQARNQELQQLQQNLQYEIQQRQSELLNPVLKSIQTAIDEIAKEMGLDYVFNQSTAQGESILLFMDESAKTKYDLNEKVVAKLK